MNFSKHLFFLFFSLFFTSKMVAEKTQLCQDSLTPQLPKWIIKTSWLAVSDPWCHTVPIYVEQNLSNQKAMEYEVGYIFNGGAGFRNHSNGVRLRLAYRYYFKPIEWSDVNFYLSAALQYRYVIDRRNEGIWRQNQSFQDTLPYSIHIQMASITGNLGFQVALDKDKRVLFDMSFGMGGRFNHGVVKGLPEDSDYPRLPFVYQLADLNADRKRVYDNYNYSFVFAMKIGYALR